MEAKDLRIGNLVNVDGVDVPQHVAEITALNCTFCNVEIIGEGEPDLSFCHEKDYIQIEGIPLTEDWLVKFGFKANPLDWYSLDGKIAVCLYEEHGTVKIALIEQGHTIWVDCKTVHHFQNAIHALVNIELELKTEVNQ